MTRRSDRVVMESGRAWWNQVSQRDKNPFSLDGYGEVAASGGDILLEAITADVRQKLELSERTTLLEVGCGAGAITQGVAPWTSGTVGADFSLGMVLHARRLSIQRANFIVADATRLPYPSAAFDRVLCYSVFNNFPSLSYAERVLHELMRVAKPGGLVLIGQVPNADKELQWQRAYAARFGAGSRSAARRQLGKVKGWLVRLARVIGAWAGRTPPAALNFLFYKRGFFEHAVAQAGHHCIVVPAYDLLQAPGGALQSDNRLDILIRTAIGKTALQR